MMRQRVVVAVFLTGALLCPAAANAAPPLITITEPTDGDALNTTPITVSGTVDDPAITQAKVLVRIFWNNRWRIVDQQTVPVLDGEFTAALLMDLREGPNQIAAGAQNAQGELGKTFITVILDTIAPVVTITSPEDGAVIGPDHEP